jgi:hypothetical protein
VVTLTELVPLVVRGGVGGAQARSTRSVSRDSVGLAVHGPAGITLGATGHATVLDGFDVAEVTGGTVEL